MARKGSSSRVRAQWRATYEQTGYQDLPWFDPDPSPQVVSAVSERFLRPGSAVLDVGCGAGSNVLYLARQGYESHGIDLSPGAVSAANERAGKEGLTVDVREGDVLDLRFPAGRFGGAIDNGCFHTLPPRRRRAYALELARVLSPGGALVLSWIGRESTLLRGPPHRPSLAEVTAALEKEFLFTRTEFHPAPPSGGHCIYDAWLTRRSSPQPPPR